LARGAFDPEPCERGWPAEEATDCDLELGESTELPLPLKECRRLEISLILAFFLDWSIYVWICLIFPCTLRSLFFEARTFRFRFSISFTCFCSTFFCVRSSF
jgi:hypothetical protein